MKKILLAGLCLVLASAALAELKMPTLYGKINKEYRYVKNETKFKYATNTNVVDVENSESRLGVKGAYDYDGLKSTYKFELGLNSTNASAERIRIRIAEGTVGNEFGAIVFGQTWMAGEVEAVLHDPLAGTGVSLVGVDQRSMVEGIEDFIGVEYRGRNDLIGYKSPKFYNFQFSTTVDKNGSASLDDTQTTGKAPTNWQNCLTYNNKFGDLSLGLTGVYKKRSGAATDKNVSTVGGLKLGYMDFAFTALYTKYSFETPNGTATKQKTENKHMMASLKYVLLKNNTFALTYGKVEVDTGLTKALTDKDSTSQIAFGYIRKLGDHLSARVTYANLKKEYDDATLETAGGNKGQIFALGAQITF
ncbi:MAG: porin [Bacteriovoracaceae bacterium]|nr:porin [Bacteriovoracaceae bacterium]